MSDHLRPITPAVISQGPIDFDLYAKEGLSKMILFARKGLEISEAHLEMLSSLNRSFYISSSDSPAYYKYSLQRLQSVIDDDNLNYKTKVKFLNDVGKQSIKNLLMNPEDSTAHKNTSKVVNHHLDLILKDPVVTHEIFKLTAMDSYTYSHSINVGLMNVLLLQAQKHAPRKELIEFGMAGVLHDIGKVYCNQQILMSHSALSDEDFLHIKSHTNFSTKVLKSQNYSQNVIDACLYHHERIDGGGYPLALSASSIPFISRVTAVSDVFDALTSKRVYKDPITHLDALQIMYDDFGHFDPDIFKLLLKVVLQSDTLVENFLDSESRSRFASSNL
jgi:HD-GYP domain-containing protein (c-di-GMP phosphodiesterase class II)